MTSSDFNLPRGIDNPARQDDSTHAGASDRLDAATRFSVDFCPICGGGLAMVRYCGGHGTIPPHGLVCCDECEAIWLEPDVSSPHLYPDPEKAVCPVCHTPIYGPDCRFASPDDLQTLGWAASIDDELTTLDTSEI